MLNTQKIVEAKQIGKSFLRVRAVDSISFHVQRGEIFALLGPNGAGKSTLVRMLIGLILPDQGSFVWRDIHDNYTKLDPSQIGYLPEDRGLYKDQRVQPTLEYFGLLRGMSRSDARQAAVEWMGKLGVQQYAKCKLETLSKGNQQKVQIASAVLHKPALAVLDEPFSGLDPINQELMLDLIRDLKTSGTTVILSAHQLNLVERLADRVLMIANGREVLSGTIDDVRRSPFAGRSLQVEFENDFHSESIPAIRAMHGVRSVDVESNHCIRIQLDDDQEITEWPRKLNQISDVRSFHCGDMSLHDIYLKAIPAQNAGRESVAV